MLVELLNKKTIKMNKNSIRNILGKVHISKKLPDEFSKRKIMVTPDARIKFAWPGNKVLHNEYEELLDIALRYVKEGDTVWDIGGNVGVFSIASADRAGDTGKVICVEPDIDLVQLLRKSVQCSGNSDLNVEIVPAAVSDRSGVMVFIISEKGRTTNSLEKVRHTRQFRSGRERQLVPTITLDHLLEVSTAPSLVKIDVEGAEHLVLNGGEHVLAEARPIIYCEVGEENKNSVTDLFRENKYNLFSPQKNTNKNLRVEKCVFNTLAIPKEKSIK